MVSGRLRKSVFTLTVFSFISLFLSSCDGGQEIRVSSEKAQKRTIIETVSASGKVQPETEVKISSDVSGEIVQLFVKEGDSVKKGQLLLEVNPDILQTVFEASNANVSASEAQLANARSRVNQAQAQFNRADADFKRSQTLFNKKAISQADFDASKAAFEVAKADLAAAEESVNVAKFNVDNARANKSQAQKNLARTVIFAPTSGIVSKLVVEKGERVVGTAQMSGTELLRIANLNEMEVKVDVNENDIVRLRTGHKAIIDIDAYPNRKFRGTVTQIANSPKSSGVAAAASEEVTNFEVKIRIDRDSYADLITTESYPFRPGMSATVEIQTKTMKDVLSVPIQSVTTREDSTAVSNPEALMKEYVFVIKGETVKMTEVKTGIQDNRYIILVSGLKDGDEVVEGPYSAISKTLKDGDKIKVVSKEELYTEEKR